MFSLFKSKSALDDLSFVNRGEVTIHLDGPTEVPSTSSVKVHGWVVSDHEVVSVQVTDFTTVTSEDGGGILLLRPRPDVVAAFPNARHVTGFEGQIVLINPTSGSVRIEVTLANRRTTRLFALSGSKQHHRQQRARKLQRIKALLLCPNCHNSLAETPINAEVLTCSQCRETYFTSPERFNFLTAELRQKFKVEDTANVSANGYDSFALSIIGEFRDGLILDCGAGLREVDYPNVVNFEVAPYPTTEVMGVNERLPFADESFDAVFSLAVLEHVKDPWKSAREISRVLKKGGVLYSVVPFLQPRHGYPNHFYNMTNEGLTALFEEDIDIRERNVLQSGRPIWTLAWFLRSWAEGLPQQTKKEFLSMKVGDLVADPLSYLDKPFVTELPIDKNFELASTTLVLGRRKS